MRSCWNANVSFWMGEEGSCPKRNFNIMQSSTSDNAPLSNKKKIILIIEHNAEKKNYPEPIFINI